MTKKEKKSRTYVTDDLSKAEKIQKAIGKNPEVTGNRLYGDRKYTFAISPEKAEEILAQPKQGPTTTL